jgi:hypothetical protein
MSCREMGGVACLLAECCAMVVFLVGAANCQLAVVVPSGDLEGRRQAVVHAFSSWNGVDPDIARLNQMARADAQRRIRRAEDLAVEYVRSKAAYLRALREHIEASRQRLQDARSKAYTTGHYDAARAELDEQAVKLGLEADALRDSLTKYSTENARTRDLRAALEGELKDTQLLRKALDEERRIYASGKEISDPFDESVSDLFARYRTLESLLTIEGARTESELTLWRAYYGGLEARVDRQIRVGPPERDIGSNP